MSTQPTANLADFRTVLAPAICASLNARDAGSAWRLEPEAPESTGNLEYVRIINSAQQLAGEAHPERIALTLDGWDRRIVARGLYGPRLDGQQWIPRDVYALRDLENPNPSMSIDKTPMQLAGDLCRRLLPGYRALLMHYREYLARETADRDAGRQLTAEIEGLTGGRLQLLRTGGDERRGQREWSGYLRRVAGVTSGHVEVSQGRVKIEAVLTPELAMRLATWIGAQPLTPEDE